MGKVPKIKVRKLKPIQNPSSKPAKSEVEKIPEELLIPLRTWLKYLFLFLKQEAFAFLAILILSFSFFTFLWLNFSIWQLFQYSIVLLGLFYSLMFVFGLLYIRLIMGFIVSIQAWEFKRKAGQHITFRALFELAKSDETMISLSVGWLAMWMTIIYDDLACYGQYIFSLLLDILSGYGYKPVRTLFWYLVVIFGFAGAYYTLGGGKIPAFFPDAVVFSLTAFHGRGFFPDLGMTTGLLHNPLVVLAAVEAVVGLVIEISFIATFTQRYFGK